MICAEDDLTFLSFLRRILKVSFSAFATEQKSGYDAKVTRRRKVIKARYGMEMVGGPDMIGRSIHRSSYFVLSKISGEAPYRNPNHEAPVV